MIAAADSEKVALCAEWLLAGMRPSQVAAQAEKSGWTLNAGEIIDLIDAAGDQLSRDAVIDPAAEDAKAINRLNALYTRSFSIQDYKTCLSIQKEITALVAKMSNPMLAGNS